MRRRITITIGLLLATGLLVLVLYNPFKTAIASDNKGSFENEAPIVIDTNQEIILSNESKKSEPPADTEFTELIKEKSTEPSDLNNVRDLLKEKINAAFLKPGWVEMQIENTSFLEIEDTFVPETGQVIYQNYILKKWILIDEDLSISAFFTESLSLNGEKIFSNFVSNGEFWQASKAEELTMINLPFLMEVEYLDDIVTLGDLTNTKIDYINEDGNRLVVITSILDFPSPIMFNGWEEANVIRLETIYYYNWETGSLIRAEEWITRVDGKRMQSNLRTAKYSLVEEISEELMQKIRYQGQ